MPDILIRDVPEEIAQALTVKASEDGKDRMAWLREQLIRLAAQPTIKTRYSFKAFGEHGAYATIERRYADHIQSGAKNCSQEQFDAYNKAKLYCERNELGDYEAAYKLLLQHFDEVFAS
jgi:hypothetical protein